MKFLLVFMITPSLAFPEGNNSTEVEARKHYGLHYSECGDYVKVFKCMTTCKSLSYKVYRIKYDCRCFCHDMKTSTVLPFPRWITNGTTRGLPKTESAKLWHVVGTLSPLPEDITSEVTSLNPCDKQSANNSAQNATGEDDTGENDKSIATGDEGVTPVLVEGKKDAAGERGGHAAPAEGKKEEPAEPELKPEAEPTGL